MAQGFHFLGNAVASAGRGLAQGTQELGKQVYAGVHRLDTKIPGGFKGALERIGGGENQQQQKPSQTTSAPPDSPSLADVNAAEGGVEAVPPSSPMGTLDPHKSRYQQYIARLQQLQRMRRMGQQQQQPAAQQPVVAAPPPRVTLNEPTQYNPNWRDWRQFGR